MFNLKENIKQNVTTDWAEVLLQDEKELDNISAKLNKEYSVKFEEQIPFYPPNHQIFNAFRHFNIAETRVCILGQDPYIRENQAMGLSFSVPDGVKIPPSLRNIYKEICSDLGQDMSDRNGDLTDWVRQGVVLLNTALTVREGKSNSHKKYWKKYTDNLIKAISDQCDRVVFLLWGKPSREKVTLIDQDKHLVLQAIHPSPLSANRGFFGCKHFSKCNEALEIPINW